MEHRDYVGDQAVILPLVENRLEDIHTLERVAATDWPEQVSEHIRRF